MIDLAALIARLEQATEGSAELDAAIADALDPEIERFGVRLPTFEIRADGTVRDIGVWRRDMKPPFTRSLDAALMLVPAGWNVKLSLSPGNGRAKIYRNADLMILQYRNTASTPALALCLAALRARQAMENVRA